MTVKWGDLSCKYSFVHESCIWACPYGAHTGLSGVTLARTGPSVPVVPLTNPVRDQAGNVIWVSTIYY